jgi:hypothetical protein
MALRGLTERVARLTSTGSGRVKFGYCIVAFVVFFIGLGGTLAEPIAEQQVTYNYPYGYYSYQTVYRPNYSALTGCMVTCLLFAWLAVAAGTGVMFRDCCRLCDDSCTCCAANGRSTNCGPEAIVVFAQTWAWNCLCAATVLWPFCAVAGNYGSKSLSLAGTLVTTAAVLLQIPAIIYAPAAAVEREARLRSNAALVLDAATLSELTVTIAPPAQAVRAEEGLWPPSSNLPPAAQSPLPPSSNTAAVASEETVIFTPPNV